MYPLISPATTIARHGSLTALVALLMMIFPSLASAGGGWVSDPGHGGIRIGHDWKIQQDEQRLDIEGDAYRSLYSAVYNYNFLYLSSEVGVMKGLELSALVTYLWASETVDSTAEDPSHIYHGFSDMWFGAKYQILDGAWPLAVAANVRLPWLYENGSTLNGQNLTIIPGLLHHDYELNFSLSHSLSNRTYASATAGFRLREGAPANQILFNGEFGGKLPFWDDRLFVKVGIDGTASVGGPGKYTSKDRFSGLSLERDSHFFDFNNSSYIRPQIGASCAITQHLDLSAGYSYIVWGHSTLVYHDVLVQLGYSF